jgi:hypothetical protein
VIRFVLAVSWAAVALIERSHRWPKTWRIARGVLLILLIGYTGMSVEAGTIKRCAIRVRKMTPNTKPVIEQSQLRGSKQDGFLQKVATVYLDGEEYRVPAPPKAVGEALDWVAHFSVRQPDKENFHSEILVEGAFRILAIKLVKEELEKMKPATGSSTREGNRKAKLRELLNGLSHLRLCGPQ